MSVATTYGQLSTSPPSIPLATTDEVPFAVDMTAQLPQGGSVSDPIVTLTDIPSGTAITLPSPTVSGNSVVQILRGADLTPGHQYLLRVVYNAAVDTVLTTFTGIFVPG